ncbi:sterol desaturase/sphingolipid hydroxylase (fatty acid hydroxylase superfamily) [Catalinimonas alkaloidigena]|nr:sterol desaturase/sphingolipid hydroxylase (fatty acid hydroxylase superfamily) [Catalinimonas alkaloidigena]
MLYQSLSVLFAHLTHANIQMPEKADRLFSYIFITPNMHKVHHHYQQPLTDSNYGNIFAFWDRIFGTYRKVKHTKMLNYGIDTHMKVVEHDRLSNLLMIPFQPYRKHPPLIHEKIEKPIKAKLQDVE